MKQKYFSWWRNIFFHHVGQNFQNVENYFLSNRKNNFLLQIRYFSLGSFFLVMKWKKVDHFMIWSWWKIFFYILKNYSSTRKRNFHFMKHNFSALWKEFFAWRNSFSFMVKNIFSSWWKIILLNDQKYFSYIMKKFFMMKNNFSTK